MGSAWRKASVWARHFAWSWREHQNGSGEPEDSTISSEVMQTQEEESWVSRLEILSIWKYHLSEESEDSESKEKLAPRYIGLYQILARRGEVAYQLSLPENLSAVHDVFHVSQLKKCLRVPEEQLPVEGLEVQQDLTYIEKPTQIIETADRVTRRKTIRMCKVRWGHHSEEEATWEREDDLLAKYPELFASQPWISRARFF
jgi:hypothetical protein